MLHDPGAPRGPRRRLVLVIPGLGTGGAELQLTAMLEAAPRAAITRFDIAVVTFGHHPSPDLARRLESLGIEVTTIDRQGQSFTSFFTRLVRYFRRARPDIVHTVLGGSTGTWGRIAGWIAKVPMIMHSERSLEPRSTRLQALLEPVANRLTHRFVVNAVAIQERLVRRGVKAERIHVLRNGVSLTRFSARDPGPIRDAWGVQRDSVVAGFLGMLRPEKRADLLLEALATLPGESRPDHVMIAGDGMMRESLERRVAGDAWLREHCRFLGVVEDTPGFLAGIDFLVLSSDTEGLPNAVLEAMAMARPCVATAVSDVPDLIAGCGMCVERGNAVALGKAIAQMTAMAPEERGSLGASARQRIERTYDLDRAALEFLALHEAPPGGPA